MCKRVHHLPVRMRIIPRHSQRWQSAHGHTAAAASTSAVGTRNTVMVVVMMLLVLVMSPKVGRVEQQGVVGEVVVLRGARVEEGRVRREEVMVVAQCRGGGVGFVREHGILGVARGTKSRVHAQVLLFLLLRLVPPRSLLLLGALEALGRLGLAAPAILRGNNVVVVVVVVGSGRARARGGHRARGREGEGRQGRGRSGLQLGGGLSMSMSVTVTMLRPQSTRREKLLVRHGLVRAPGRQKATTQTYRRAQVQLLDAAAAAAGAGVAAGHGDVQGRRQGAIRGMHTTTSRGS